nr:MAG TPA: hypothetical protein [Caudoviricetes sp.]
MIEIVQEIIKTMKENDVRSIDVFHTNEVVVWVDGVKLLKEFDDVKITPNDVIKGVAGVEVTLDGIVFRGSVNDEELAEYQKAKAVA